VNPNVQMFLADRARARAAGDHGLERAIQADLDRLGYVEPSVERVEKPDGMETTAVRAPERAVPAPKRRTGGYGKPKR
jgi:hypothetical protein